MVGLKVSSAAAVDAAEKAAAGGRSLSLLYATLVSSLEELGFHSSPAKAAVRVVMMGPLYEAENRVSVPETRAGRRAW